MIMTQSSNDPSDEFLEAWQMKLHLLTSKQRIEIHIYINEWVTLTNELLGPNSYTLSLDNNIRGLATKLLVMVTGHVKALAMNWFQGMLMPVNNFTTHMPCWKCYAEIETPRPLSEGTCECVLNLYFFLHGTHDYFPWSGKINGSFICEKNNPISSFVVEDHIVTAALGKTLKCCFHGNVKIMHMAPDLVSHNDIIHLVHGISKFTNADILGPIK